MLTVSQKNDVFSWLLGASAQIALPGSSGWRQMGRWYQMVPAGARWCQVVPDGARCYQMLQDAARPDAASCCEIFPDAPVARGVGDVIVHRAVLDDITGIPTILDWLSDGDIVILEMSRLLSVETELRMAVERIQNFVESDMAGEVIRLGTSRLLLIPSTFAISENRKNAY